MKSSLVCPACGDDVFGRVICYSDTFDWKDGETEKCPGCGSCLRLTVEDGRARVEAPEDVTL